MDKAYGMLTHFVEMSDLQERLRKIEEVLINVFDNDDENVVSLIVNDIRKNEGLENFAYGAHSDDHIKLSNPCPYCGSVNIDEKIGCDNAYDNKICVEDSLDWMIPRRYCHCCEKYFDYKHEGDK
jgi:hypothetical protein